MSKDSSERHIPFENGYNFRDVGGYRTHHGRTVRWGRLFRSADPCYMTKQDAERARDVLGIRTMIDLRSDWEAETFGSGPLAQPPVRYYNIPLFGSSRPVPGIARTVNPPLTLPESYLRRLRSPQFWERLAGILALILESDACPLVFHCVGGKDRTGILAAVVQGILGVADEDIIADYAMTEQCIAPSAVDELRRAHLQSNPQLAQLYKQVPPDFFHARPETMEEVLEAVHQEHGSMRDYAAARGVSAQVLQRLEDELLSES